MITTNVNNNESKNEITTNSNSSSENTKLENISKEQAEEILKDKYGTEDKETGYTISYGYMAKVKDENDKEYYAFRQTWLVNSRSSFLKNIFISTDGKDIKTSEVSKGYEDGQIIDFSVTSNTADNSIYGKWYPTKAVKNGEETNLKDVFGSAFTSNDCLTLNEDGTYEISYNLFSVDEKGRTGTYELENDKITLKANDGGLSGYSYKNGVILQDMDDFEITFNKK